jgi:hypothetical protein
MWDKLCGTMKVIYKDGTEETFDKCIYFINPWHIDVSVKQWTLTIHNIVNLREVKQRIFNTKYNYWDLNLI